MPKFDAKPVFYSQMDHATPLGLIYSITLPISFSGTIVINKPNYLSGNIFDFIIGDQALYSSIITQKMNISRAKYCIMPFFDSKTEKSFNEYTNTPLITGRSDQCTLTTHLNPFDDIRIGSFGMPINYTECMIDCKNDLLIKTPYLPTIYENGEIKEYEWYDSHTMAKIVDNYYYAL